MSDLKQMQFVDDISTRAVKMAESTYSAVRQRTPKFLDPHVASVEGTLQPYYAKAGDMSSSMLKSVDATVRCLLHRARLALLHPVPSLRLTSETGFSYIPAPEMRTVPGFLQHSMVPWQAALNASRVNPGSHLHGTESMQAQPKNCHQIPLLLFSGAQHQLERV